MGQELLLSGRSSTIKIFTMASSLEDRGADLAVSLGTDGTASGAKSTQSIAQLAGDSSPPSSSDSGHAATRLRPAAFARYRA